MLTSYWSNAAIEVLPSQVGEVCASGIQFINSSYNGVLVQGSGRIVMVIGTILMSAFVFLRNLRQLEIAGDFGFIIVLIMVIVIMASLLFLPTQCLCFDPCPYLNLLRKCTSPATSSHYRAIRHPSHSRRRWGVGWAGVGGGGGFPQNYASACLDHCRLHDGLLTY